MSNALSNYDYPDTMMATLYPKNGTCVPTWTRVPTPTILKPTDCIIRVHKTTICGTDLHILRGSVVTCLKNTIMGHEGIGHIVEIGSAVTKFTIGDRILVPCITRCNECHFCKKHFYGHCEMGGWILGHTINGMQAEYARIPLVDTSCYCLPLDVTGQEEDKYVMLSDILPTGFEIGLLDGNIRDGNSIGIVGVGPVGLAALMSTIALYKPTQIYVVDIDPGRLQVAKDLGATHIINNTNNDAAKQIMDLTDGHGLDLVVECIGMPVGWYVCQEVVKPGGHIAILGVHGQSATINLEKMWYRNFKLSAGMVHCFSIGDLMKKVYDGSLMADKLISHRFGLSNIPDAYSTFANAKETGSLKVIVENNISKPLISCC